MNIFASPISGTPQTENSKNSEKVHMTPPLTSDVFVRSKSEYRFVPKKIVTVKEGDRGAYKRLSKEAKELHERRYEKFGTEAELPPPREVTDKEYKAINNVQFEECEYDSVQNKLKSHQPLSKKEKEFFDFVVSQMKPCEEDKTLYRTVYPYEGLEEQIKSGKVDFDILTSTASQYDSFYDFWTTPESIPIGDREYEVSFPYLLKINVAKGTKMLDCNAKCKGRGTRSRSEVVLPPGSCKVESIDNNLGVIELTLTDTKDKI